MRLIKIRIIISFINSLAYADKEMKIGSKGNLDDGNRVVKVVMYDNYYEPSSFKIKAGETIKFELINGRNLCISSTRFK